LAASRYENRVMTLTIKIQGTEKLLRPLHHVTPF